MSATPVWVDARAILLLHNESLAMFGGARGLCDAGLLESALARPVNQCLYKSACEISELAAAYAFGLAKNHPFVDKRTAFLALGLFLAVNKWKLETTQIDAIETMLSLAQGTLDETSMAIWIRDRMVRTK